VSIPLEDKKILIVDNAGHSSMRSKPILIVSEMINWIEKYR